PASNSSWIGDRLRNVQRAHPNCPGPRLHPSQPFHQRLPPRFRGHTFRITRLGIPLLTRNTRPERTPSPPPPPPLPPQSTAPSPPMSTMAAASKPNAAAGILQVYAFIRRPSLPE